MPTYIQGSWPPNKGCPVAVQIAWVRSGENTARLVFLLLFIVLVFILCRFYFRISRAVAIRQCASMSFNVDHSYTFPERRNRIINSSWYLLVFFFREMFVSDQR